MIPRAIVAAFLLSWLAGCSRSAEPPQDLSNAVAVVGYLASARFMDRSAFSATAEKATPSEFVSYLSSDLGAPVLRREFEMAKPRRRSPREVSRHAAQPGPDGAPLRGSANR